MVVWQKTEGCSVMYNDGGHYDGMAEDCKIQRHV